MKLAHDFIIQNSENKKTPSPHFQIKETLTIINYHCVAVQVCVCRYVCVAHVYVRLLRSVVRMCLAAMSSSLRR